MYHLLELNLRLNLFNGNGWKGGDAGKIDPFVLLGTGKSEHSRESITKVDK